jgi:peroxiredoxin Q/BCP
MSLKVGDAAPLFDVTAHDGRRIALSDFAGKRNVVLFFYPKDETSICTKEACGFRDAYEELMGQDTEVIGVSYDSNASHDQFARRHHLPFPLLPDTSRALAKAYGATSLIGGLFNTPSRITFLIGKNGAIAGIFRGALSADVHVEGIREAVKKLPAA